MKFFAWIKSLAIDRPKSAEDGSEGSGLLRAYLASLLIWNPLICPLLGIFLGGFDHIARRIVSCLIISTVVSSTCFAVVGTVYHLERQILQARKRAIRKHSRGWWMSISICAMPLGLFFALSLMKVWAPRLGLGGTYGGLDDYRFGMLIGSTIALIFFLLQGQADMKAAKRDADLKLKNLENERLQAQISALTAQMNPHLMFNALNTVASLVQTDPQEAENTIVRLAELYRGVLNSSRRMTHPLATEIAICEAYLAVEKARFKERLQCQIEIDPNINAEVVDVPALCLQPLVENAIKHGLAPRAAGGKVEILAVSSGDVLTLTVQDNGVGLSESTSRPKRSGNGLALQNCRDRLQLHFGNLGHFAILDRVGGGTMVTLTMPLSGGT